MVRGRAAVAIAVAVLLSFALLGCDALKRRASGRAGADGVHDPKLRRSVLFVGNSLTFTNDLPGLIHTLDPRVEVDSITAGGIALADHIQNGLVAARLNARHFSHVVLQERSTEAAANPSGFSDAARVLIAESAASGALPILFEPWARRDASDPVYRETWSGGDPLALQARLHETTARVAHANHAALAPIGQALFRVRAVHPEITLYVPDGNHPAPPASYLAACMLLELITGEAPDASARPRFPLAPEEGEALRRAAHQGLLER